MSKTPRTIAGPSPDALTVYLQNNKVPPEKLPEVIRMFSGLGAPAPQAPAARTASPRPQRTSAPPRAAAPKASAVAKTSATKASAKAAKAAAARPVASAEPAKKGRPRKEVAKAGNTGSFVLDVAIPTRNLKSSRGQGSRRKFLGIRQVNDPAVPIEQSVLQDHIICLEDGKKFKMMKRWLRATYGMSPEEYRAKWGLPEEYPMVAPGYSREKSDYAKIQGLGTVENKQHGKSSVRELNQAVGRVGA